MTHKKCNQSSYCVFIPPDFVRLLLRRLQQKASTAISSTKTTQAKTTPTIVPVCSPESSLLSLDVGGNKMSLDLSYMEGVRVKDFEIDTPESEDFIRGEGTKVVNVAVGVVESAEKWNE